MSTMSVQGHVEECLPADLHHAHPGARRRARETRMNSDPFVREPLEFSRFWRDLWCCLSLPSRTLGFLVSAARIPLVAAAQGNEDFSNNLFSDLAPILALFGEQVSKQFMAGSITWEDNIIFAMNPIGVLTAMVGAIRIGGPMWLRAIIGRARESKAVAEVELTTSTSEDVCELWNGLTIVRIPGSPQVVQLIYLPDKCQGPSYGLYTLNEEAKRKGVFIQKDGLANLHLRGRLQTVVSQVSQNLGRNLRISQFLTERRQRKPHDEESSSVSAEASHAAPGSDPMKKNTSKATKSPLSEKAGVQAPNIYLNLPPQKTRYRKWELRFFALFAVALQSSVLVFAGFATYRPRWDTDDATEDYAYPLTAIGTLIMVFGVWICATVIERSTTEETWKIVQSLAPQTKGVPTGNPKNARIVWLQQGGGINDQHFESYAIFGQGARTSITTSRLTDIAHHHFARTRNGGRDVAFKPVDKPLSRHPTAIETASKEPTAVEASGITRLAVTFGTSISLAGFIAQFTGLRGMHWSVAIAQLIATLVMVAVRAWVRRELVSDPSAYRTPQNHELDWLATRIARDAGNLWHDLEGPAEQDHGSPSAIKLISTQSVTEVDATEVCGKNIRILGQECWNWDVLSGEGVEQFRFRPSEGKGPETPRESPAHVVMKIRERLGNLSQWTGTASEPAVSVANAIEVVMNTLFTGSAKYSSTTSMTWSMAGRSFGTDEGKPSPIQLKVYREPGIDGGIGRWRSDATEIEAVLSLWLYSIRAHESAAGPDEEFDQKGFERLRHSDSAPKKPTLRLLGPKTETYMRNLVLYLGEGLDGVSEATDLATGQERVNRPAKPASPTSLPPFSKFPAENQSLVDELSGSKLDSETEAHFELRYLNLEPGVESHFQRRVQLQRHRIFGFSKYQRDSVATVARPNMETQPETGVVGPREKDTIAQPTDTTTEPPDHQSHPSNPTEPTEDNPVLAVFSESPLELLLAQDMFSTFMWAVAEKIEVIGGETSVRSGHSQSAQTGFSAWWQSLRLDNSVISKMVKDVERVSAKGLGDIHDIYLSIIPPLSFHKKLPAPLCLLDHVHTGALEHQSAGRWMEASLLYTWLFYIYGRLEKTSSLAVRTTAMLYNFSRMIGDLNNICAIQSLESDEPNLLDRIATNLHLNLNIADPELVYRLRELYEVRTMRRRFRNPQKDFRGFPGASDAHEKVLLGPGPILHRPGESLSPDHMGLTPTHYAAIVGVDKKVLRHLATLEALPGTDLYGWTAVHYAVACDTDLDLQVFIRSTGATRNAMTWVDLSGRTPLHYASWEITIWILLQNGVGLEIQGRDGLAALHLSALRGHPQATRAFLEAGAIIDVLDYSRRTPLHLAAYAGHHDIVEPLVLRGARHDARDDNGRSPLHLCAASGKLDQRMMKLLKFTGINSMVGDRRGMTPLHLAASGGHQTAVDCLLDGFESLGPQRYRIREEGEKRDRLNWTELHHAARNGHMAIARTLIRKLNSEVDARENEGLTPLHLAARHGHERMVHMLLAVYGADLEARGNDLETPLHLTARQGHEDTAITLIDDFGADVTAKTRLVNGTWTALSLACISGRDAVVAMLMRKFGANAPGMQDHAMNPLHLASMNGHLSTVRILITEFSLEVEAQEPMGKTALLLAAMNGHESIARMLICDFGANIQTKDKKEMTALHLASLEDHESTARMLLREFGAELEARDRDGRTAMQLAAEENHDATVRMLVGEFGSDIEAKDASGSTALLLAASRGHQHMVRTLHQLGADVHTRNERGGTPLHGAVVNNCLEVVEMLIESFGVDPNAKDFDGFTALHVAASLLHIRIAEMLVERLGAEINAKTCGGRTALDIARRVNAKPMVQMLIDHGALENDTDAVSTSSEESFDWMGMVDL